jgi:hypothetical protein
MDRSNHYEAAFEAYLRRRRLCYVAVDEAKRSLVDDEPVKSLDFVVYGEADARLLVDVKGRKFPGGTPDEPRRVWECWAERDDVSGLRRWEQQFGPGYVGLLVFVYQIAPEISLPDDVEDLWEFRGRRYLSRAVAADEFSRHMRIRSPKWDTVDLPTSVYQSLVLPFRSFTDAAAAIGP